jgi:hypothetical protein
VGALAGLAIATFILYCVLPVGVDSRYIVALVPSVVLFAAAGVDEFAHRLGARLRFGVVRVGSAMALMAAFCVRSFALPLQLRSGDYAKLVRDVEAGSQMSRRSG